MLRSDVVAFALLGFQLRMCVALTVEGRRSQGETWKIGSKTVPPTAASARRRTMILSPLSQWLSGLAFVPLAPARVLAVPALNNKATVVLRSPNDTLGIELIETKIGAPPKSVLAIVRVASPKSSSSAAPVSTGRLLPGMVCRDFTLQSLKDRVQLGPYPIEIEFENLALGGDAVTDFGTSMVSSQDALALAQSPPPTGSVRAAPAPPELKVTVLQPAKAEDCANIQSRRGDLLEVRYEASRQAEGARDGGSTPFTTYDSSETRGTGQPYQMVLGSGDMLPGVDLGLYEMCPGEVRRIEIPAQLAYGARGNKIFGIPPDASLVWAVELVSINSVRPGDDRSRDDVEGRFPYR